MKKQHDNSGPAQYPEGYPFEDLLFFAADCKDVVKFFYNHHAPIAYLKNALDSAKLSGLVHRAPLGNNPRML
jgi:hypothetical protein